MSRNRFYYISADGRTHGPFWLTQMRALWQGGKLTMNTAICREGTNEWTTVEFMPEIFESEARMPALSRMAHTPSDPRRLLIGMCVLLGLFVTWKLVREFF